jgi:hypothetical protein
MMTLQHIRLYNHKGLKSATLNDLEKINVVCGPNNSGKTTVLECIANQNFSAIGLSITPEHAKKIAQDSAQGFGWSSGDTHLNGKFLQVVQQALATEAVWFANDVDRLFGLIQWERHFGNWANPTGRLRQVFPLQFAPRPAVALVPAKRRLETHKAVQAADLIQADGAGILNFLFAAKNQDEMTITRGRFDHISNAFTEISAGYEFQVFLQSNNVVELRFRRHGGSWVLATDCGLGLQDVLIILYFALASDHDVVLIEEPENHLHPEIQRRLINFLREKTEKQFFVSTHSSVFLNTQFADRVFSCRMTESVQVENATSRAALLTELGYSIADNLVSDLIVLCEGPKDKPVLEEFFLKTGLLDRINIKVWPLGGDIMDQLDLSVFQESHRIVALIDGDPGSSVVRKRFIRKCEDLKIPVTRLERYSLENYFSLAAIASVMKPQTPTNVTALDPKKSVYDQLGFQVKGNGGKIAKEMTLDDIKGTDFDAFLKQVATFAQG